MGTIAIIMYFLRCEGRREEKLFNLILHFSVRPCCSSETTASSLLLTLCFLFLFNLAPNPHCKIRIMTETFLVLFIIHVLSVFSERCVWVQVHKSFKGFDEEGVCVFFCHVNIFPILRSPTNKQTKKNWD